MHRFAAVLAFQLLGGFPGFTPGSLMAQCGQNELINPGFETVGPPCGPVPPNGLINGSFNQGCMDGWFSAWGTPSVCSNNPYEGNYYACLGANNEGFYQDIAIEPGSIYCLSFRYRRLNAGTGSLDVYLAAGLTNQPMSNSGNLPLAIDPAWQLLGSFPSTGGAWEEVVISPFTPIDPANTQLLFLDVPTGGLDVGIDDVLLTVAGSPDPNAVITITCVQQDGNNFVFEGSVNPLPPGWDNATWTWTFGDGQSGSGQSVSHTYTAFGTYDICLTVSAQCGCAFYYCMPFDYNACICNCGVDSDPPEFLQFDPGPFTVFCEEDIPPPVPPLITDCDATASVSLQEYMSGPTCDRTILYEWTAVDGCGNTTIDTQVIFFIDNTPPDFTSPPLPEVASCEDFANEFSNWLDAFGGAEVTNDCADPVTLSYQYDALPEGTCGSVEVTFLASDACGNEATASAIFTITDTSPPEWLVPPSDLTFYCEVPDISLVQTWLDQAGGGLATDNCGSTVVTNNYSGDPVLDSTQVIFTATDECFQSTPVSAWIIILPQADTVVTTTFTCDPSAAGVDSILDTEGACTLLFVDIVQFLPSDTTYVELVVCDANSVGSDTTYLLNASGCDSLVIQQSIYIVPDTQSVFLSTCVPGQVGIDTSAILASTGCDSLLILTETTLLPSDTTFLQQFVCQPLAAGADTLYLVNRFGCDSLIVLQSLYTAPDTQRIDIPTCNPAAVTSDTTRLFSLAGCDSLITITSVFLTGNTIVAYDQVIVCGEGQPITDTLIIPGAFCDTVSITTTLFAPPDTSYLEERVCSAADSGTITFVLTNLAGCDSLIVLHKVYIPPVRITVVDSVCTGPEGIAVAVIPDRFGCDSLVITTQTLNVAPDTLFVRTFTCDSVASGINYLSVPGPFCDTVKAIEQVWLGAFTTIDTVLSCNITGIVRDTLVLVSSQGCDSLVVVIPIESTPMASVVITDESCAGFGDGQISVGDVQGGIPPYSWSFSDGPFTSDTTWSPLLPGDYEVVVRDAEGCSDTITGLTVLPGQVFIVDAGADQLVDQGDVISLNAGSPFTIAQLEWLASDPIACYQCPATILGPVTTDQWVILDALSDAGCRAKDSLSIRVIPTEPGDIGYYVPNIFSPDGDGVNDYFFVSASIPTEAMYDMSVYDRWGNLLFLQHQRIPNTPEQGWDGISRDQPCSPGVYVYQLVIREASGKQVRLSGDVTLIR